MAEATTRGDRLQYQINVKSIWFIIIITSILLIKTTLESSLPAGGLETIGFVSDVTTFSCSYVASSYTCSRVEIGKML